MKKESREAKIELRGRNSANFHEMIRPSIEKAIELSVEANRDWLENEWNKITEGLEDEDIVPFSEVIKIFQSTLEKKVKMITRLREIPIKEIIGQDERFTPIFDQAVFDFIISIRKSKKRDDPLLQMLSLAELSHWLNPGDIARLNEKYKDKADQSVIKSAALSYPKGPDAFIDSYLLQVARLNEKYKDKADPSVIKSAALSYPKGPDAFIDWFIEMKKYLLSSQPDRKTYLVVETLLSNHFKSKEELNKLI